MLLKKKIIASSISNLTDARYFAGWMVDYIVFNVDPEHEFYTNPQEIGSFQSWVEGPQYVLEMRDEQFAFAEKYLVDLNCQSIIIPFSKRALISSLDVDVMYSLSLEEFVQHYDVLSAMSSSFIIDIIDVKAALETLSGKSVRRDVFLNLTDVQISGKELLDDTVDGFMVHGSPEEKVGFKSFDELDDIFEVLQDF